MLKMRAEKSNISVYTPLVKSSILRTANIIDLIKKNREEQKKEKISKFYTLVAFSSLIIFFGILFLL